MRLLKIISVLFGLAILAAACTGSGDDDASPSITSDSTDATDTSAASSSTTSTTTSTTAPPETRPTQTVEGAWAETWRVLLGLGPSGVTSAGLATDEAAEALGRFGLDGTTTAEHYPRLDIITGRPDKGPAEIALTDCVLFDTHPPIWLTGNLTRADETEDWVVTSIDVIDAFGKCVPKEVADAAIAGAQAFWDAQSEFWDPADPDHPLIAETTTGDYQSFLEDLLARLEPDEVRGRLDQSRPNFAVIRVTTSNLVVLGNCYVPDPDYGWYTPDGEYVDGSTPVAPGQINYEELEMKEEAGNGDPVWKVEVLRNRVDDDCEPDSTALNVPVH